VSDQWVDVKADYGATGDDSADDTTAIRNAIAACATGGTVLFPPGYVFKVTGAITVSKSLTLLGYGSTLHQVTVSTAGVVVSASDVRIRGLTVKGHQTPGSITYNGSEDGVQLHASGVGSAYARSVIVDCEIYGFGDVGIDAAFVNDCTWEENYVHDCGYGAIMSISPQRGRISRNHCATIGPGTSGNMYGIAVTRNGSSSLTTDPRATDVIIAENFVENVAWEGIDTHAGQRIQIVDNTITNCDEGITGTTSPFGATALAPLECTISRNVVNSTKTDGSASDGISLLGTADEYATGKIHDNTVIGHGDQSNSWSGGVIMYYTRGVSVRGNYGRDCSPCALQASHNNIGVNVTGNTSQDNWSTAVTNANGVAVASTPNSGIVANNTVVRGTKSATHVNTAAAFVTAGNTITTSNNLLYT
jgi:hypothetical protein